MPGGSRAISQQIAWRLFLQERANAPVVGAMLSGPRERKKTSYGDELSDRDWGVSVCKVEHRPVSSVQSTINPTQLIVAHGVVWKSSTETSHSTSHSTVSLYVSVSAPPAFMPSLIVFAHQAHMRAISDVADAHTDYPSLYFSD